MRSGSNKILFMIVVYLVITIVMFILFGPLKDMDLFSSASSAKTDEQIHEERIIGNAGYVNTGEAYDDEYRNRGKNGNETSDGTGAGGNGAAGEEAGGSQDANADGSGEGSGNGSEASDAQGGNGTAGSEGGSDSSDQNADVHYYKFKVINIDSLLRVRDSGSFNSKVIARIKNGREGYVLEKGDEWTKIVVLDPTYTGYCYSEYLQFTEIPKSEFPKEYVDQVK